MQERIRSILSHDLSGVGRVSLNAIIPIFSHYCIESIALPTSVFSSQTDGFTKYAFTELTSFMKNTVIHWESIQLKADALYSGFLSSPEQIDILDTIIRTCLRQNALIIIDPVLGDEGELFSSLPASLVSHMQNYIKQAHSITPNFTEICLLLNEDYVETPSFFTVKNYLKKLAIGKIRYVIGTSILLEEETNPCVLAYDKNKDYFIKIPYIQIDGHFPGAGDCFTSIFMAYILRQHSLVPSLIRAVDFITHAITITKKTQSPPREGLLLERSLHSFSKQVSRIRGRYAIYR
ncbi:MAG: pyridoxamine kinase [Desulfovibrionaceae bacterium]